jgi:hypothetical protein
MKAKQVNEMRVVDKGMYVDEEYMEDVLTSIIHGNMGFFGGVGEEGQVRDAFEERIMDDPELAKILSDGLKRNVPARMMGKRLYKMMNTKGLANYGDVLEKLNERDSWSDHDKVLELPEDVADIIQDFCELKSEGPEGEFHSNRNFVFNQKELEPMVMAICSKAADVMGGLTISNPWKEHLKESVNEGSEDFYHHKPFGNNPGQADVDRQNAQKARRFDGSEYWQEVALNMGGTLGDLETGDDYRLIRIMHPEFGGIDIDQDWSKDGSPTKPVTKVDTRQDNEDLGRFAIWDDAADYAGDIMAIVHKIADDIDEAGITGMHL